ncbi:uncharacterized protein BJ171DRAFT_476698 [Polychytrium aggregatum]|uniref:uncharacterized protein n=1 Tax=Polychytrium aggregatum TaxID=110093 RepID=UPI0022FECDCF|nr:uncharacterized protein BJ171DRAFT_476698 [Polychytrium aggregatum]KAI9202496.1 hypothetical protein BJ171DRAFT_476698 [Polychytrium aggregatum]
MNNNDDLESQHSMESNRSVDMTSTVPLGTPILSAPFEERPRTLSNGRSQQRFSLSHASDVGPKKPGMELCSPPPDRVWNDKAKPLLKSENRGSTSSMPAGKRAHRASTPENLYREHPIAILIKRTKASIMDSAVFKKTILFLSDEVTRVIFWLAIAVVAHALVTGVFIVALYTVMPGIWVYNFLQLFVIACALLAHHAGTRISDIVRLSITASELVRGKITLAETADFWVKGKKSPGYSIIQISNFIEVVSELILIGCSISFVWDATETFLLQGTCNPPNYVGSVLSPNIAIQQFIQGDADFATVYNYGLPLSDGMIGAWAGWPMNNPMNAFMIEGEGPVYIIQAQCNNGIVQPSVDTQGASMISSTVLSSDSRGFMLEMLITMPPGSVFDDIAQTVVNSTYQQECSVFVQVGVGAIQYSFVSDQWSMVTGGRLVAVSNPSGSFSVAYPTSISTFSQTAQLAFRETTDTYGVLPLIQQSVLQSILNASYYPSQGATFCNYLSWATYPDGYYHTEAMYRGVTAGIGSSAHYAIMQYNPSLTVDCNYYGFAGAGMLSIPPLPIIIAAIGSATAILSKIAEIIYWATMRATKKTPGFIEARRALQHPMRFALDTAHTLSKIQSSGSDDYCNATTRRSIRAIGKRALRYGEDINTCENEVGHLQIGEAGFISMVKEEKMYGSFTPTQHVEWDNFTQNN